MTKNVAFETTCKKGPIKFSPKSTVTDLRAFKIYIRFRLSKTTLDGTSLAFIWPLETSVLNSLSYHFLRSVRVPFWVSFFRFFFFGRFFAAVVIFLMGGGRSGGGFFIPNAGKRGGEVLNDLKFVRFVWFIAGNFIAALFWRWFGSGSGGGFRSRLARKLRSARKPRNHRMSSGRSRGTCDCNHCIFSRVFAVFRTSPLQVLTRQSPYFHGRFQDEVYDVSGKNDRSFEALHLGHHFGQLWFSFAAHVPEGVQFAETAAQDIFHGFVVVVFKSKRGFSRNERRYDRFAPFVRWEVTEK